MYKINLYIYTKTLIWIIQSMTDYLILPMKDHFFFPEIKY